MQKLKQRLEKKENEGSHEKEAHERKWNNETRNHYGWKRNRGNLQSTAIKEKKIPNLRVNNE